MRRRHHKPLESRDYNALHHHEVRNPLPRREGHLNLPPYGEVYCFFEHRVARMNAGNLPLTDFSKLLKLTTAI
jgi:hypothetical protein